MGALCTNNKEIHEKLKFLQLGKDVVRQRILSVVIELSRILYIFVYSSKFLNTLVFFYVVPVLLSIFVCSCILQYSLCSSLYTSCGGGS